MVGFPRSMRIGSVEAVPATVLAPMAGVTDTIFRRFIRGLGGCGLLMTEFTSSHGVVARNPRRTMKYLAFQPDEHPIGAQLFGADPRWWRRRRGCAKNWASTWWTSTSAAR